MKKYLLFALLPLTAMAAPIKGFQETYKDWNLVCDNTGTCRMAGYQSNETDSLPVSILFTREAGEQGKISAELTFFPFDFHSDKEIQTDKTSEIFLDGQSLGTVENYTEKPSALNEAQTVALLNALKKSSKIEVVSGQFKGEVSDQGAAAAMLKMDEFQQRLNTPSALIRKDESNKAVLQAQPEPTIKAVKIPNRKAYSIDRGTKRFDEVIALLRQSNKKADHNCEMLHSEEEYMRANSITIYPLTNGKVLAETMCWRGAYQEGYYYAVMDEKLTKVEQVLADKYNGAMYNDDHSLSVNGSFKGRGFGDCWSRDDAIWNGKIFIRTAEWTTGSCKGFTGGAWELPIFVSKIVVK